jgi:hypothetical protein
MPRVVLQGSEARLKMMTVASPLGGYNVTPPA